MSGGRGRDSGGGDSDGTEGVSSSDRSYRGSNNRDSGIKSSKVKVPAAGVMEVATTGTIT